METRNISYQNCPLSNLFFRFIKYFLVKCLFPEIFTVLGRPETVRQSPCPHGTHFPEGEERHVNTETNKWYTEDCKKVE